MKLELHRRYRFSAAHRLWSPRFTGTENRQLYGKCANPYGHGHNYTLDVAVTGPVDPSTGMIANLADVDAFVQREVLEVFDHRNLNTEVPAFRDRVPTAENLCVEIFARLKRFPGARLVSVRLEETGFNSFEYQGDSQGGLS